MICPPEAQPGEKFDGTDFCPRRIDVADQIRAADTLAPPAFASAVELTVPDAAAHSPEQRARATFEARHGRSGGPVGGVGAGPGLPSRTVPVAGPRAGLADRAYLRRGDHP